jgi:O-antigen/teichoic acid export membrane protein
MKDVLKDKVFLKNIGKLFGSSFIAQLIPFAALPVLTRIYSPEDFGFWAYFLSLSGIISIIMTGNYEFAIVLPKEDSEALNVTIGSISLVLLIFALTLLTLPLFSGMISESAGLSQGAVQFTIWISVMSLSMALFRISGFWNNRNNRFGRMGAGNISRSLSASSIQLFNGFYLNVNYSGLAAGSVLGYFSGFLILSGDLIKQIIKQWKNITAASVMQVLKRYKKFPKYFMPSEFMNFLSSNVPVIFLTNVFNAGITGLYAVPHKFINTPMTMLGSSISQAYFKKSNDIKNSGGDLGHITSDIYRKLMNLGIVPISVIAAYGDYIFAFLLGDKWEISGVYASLIAPWMLMVFVASPISIVFATLEMQEVSLKLNSFLLFIRILSFVIGGFVFKSAMIAIFLYGASGFVYWLYFSFYVIKVSGGDRSKIVRFSISRLIFIMLPIILSRMLLNV